MSSPRTTPPRNKMRRQLLTALAVTGLSAATLFAQTPFRFPTANHALYEPGQELKFFAPTAPVGVLVENVKSLVHLPAVAAHAAETAACPRLVRRGGREEFQFLARLVKRMIRRGKPEGRLGKQRGGGQPRDGECGEQLTAHFISRRRCSWRRHSIPSPVVRLHRARRRA